MNRITRFMEVMFSNTDEELANQVDRDIKTAQRRGSFEDEDVKYDRTANGDVAITDKANGEVTLAQKSPDEADTYDLIAVPDEQLEKFLHPSADGVTPGYQRGAPDEDWEDHVDDLEDPEEAWDIAEAGPQDCDDCEEEVREFSISTDNFVVQKLFSMPQEYIEYLFSEVIDSSETSIVGDLKIEKCADDDDSVIVTSKSTGDQAKITLDDEDMEVTELDTKDFSDSSQYMPFYVIGVQPYDHYIVEAQEYDEESAEELKEQLEEDGVESVQIFETQGEARDYAIGLLQNLGADSDSVEEPEEEREYSEYVGSPVWTVSYDTEDSVFMSRMFSEEALGIASTRDDVERAISSGDPIELEDGTIVTPIDAQNALIEDGEEATIATICGDDVQLEKIDNEEAEAIKHDGEIMEYEAQHQYSICNAERTRFFSENEYFTDYMERLFSEEADQDHIEDAIANGDELETEDEIITPVDSKTAVVEDKGNGEFTKVTILDDDTLNVHPISEDEADNLMENISVSGNEEIEDDEDEDEEEKEYSFCNEEGTRFFSEDEYFTDYMVRLFSEEADQSKIEDAIANGDELETDDEIITPIDSKTAVIEDKDSGEFTKATIEDDDIDVEAISEEEADELTKDLKVEDNDEDEEEKEYSFCNEEGTRFFSEDEYFTDYMERLYTEEADQEHIEEAIEDGEQVETDDEIITPIDSKTAVIEDKDSGEFTKATIEDDDIDVEAISEEEADELTKDLKVEDNDEDEEKKFSDIYLLGKFFAEAGVVQQPMPQQGAPVQAQAPVQVPAEEAPVEGQEEVVVEEEQAPTVEQIEDKALAAIQSIRATVEEGVSQIMEAKANPAPMAEPEIQEAQFSERSFGQTDTLFSWLENY